MKKLILAIVIIFFLSLQNKWNFILNGDIQNYYFPIAQKNFDSRVLIYPPGANLYFMILPSFTLEIFKVGFYVVNILLLLMIGKIISDKSFLTGIVICTGPILLFRFDLLVIFFVLIACKFFSKGNYYWSGAFLGLAVTTKLFPIIFFPYFLFSLWCHKRNLAIIGGYILSFLLVLAMVFWFYIFLSELDLSEILEHMITVFKLQVHMESVMATFLVLITAITNPGYHGVDFIDAVWVLDPLYYLGHKRIFSYVSLVGISVVYLLILSSYKQFSYRAILLLTLVLIITSRIFSPQYMIWIAFLGLITDLKLVDRVLILIALVCTQIVYPLNYGELIDFFEKGKNLLVFGVLALRNLLLVILFIRLLVDEKLVPFLSKGES